jgi:hypothetical protein
MNVSATLDESVGKICHKQNGHQTENPLSAGLEIFLEAVIVGHLFREQQHAQQILNYRIHGDKEIEREGPVLNHLQAIFPPAEMNQIEKNE